MNLIRHDSRRPLRWAAVAALGLLSTAPALAYDDKSTISQVMALIGVRSDEPASSIDYSERPKIVLPPSQQRALPEPREGAATRRADWPTHAQSGRRGVTGPRGAAANGNTDLVEPPATYKQATKDLSAYRDAEPAKSDWTNPLSYVRQQASKVIGGN